MVLLFHFNYFLEVTPSLSSLNTVSKMLAKILGYGHSTIKKDFIIKIKKENNLKPLINKFDELNFPKGNLFRSLSLTLLPSSMGLLQHE